MNEPLQAGTNDEEDLPAGALDAARLRDGIERSCRFLLSRQHEDGYWVDELESNATITAELVFFMHFMGIDDSVKLQKCREYLLKQRRADGSWAIYYGAPGDISVTVEAYMALKMAGADPDSPEMLGTRQFILSHGGIRKTRVFTKIFLAMLGQISWDPLPAMPVEFMLLPERFGVNIYEMSSWSRSVIVPLLIVYALQPVCPPPAGRDARELFTENDRDLDIAYEPGGLSWRNFFIFLDKAIKFLGRSPWKPLRQRALDKAKQWLLDHQEDQGDWAGIQPAMFNSMLAFKFLGYPKDHPVMVKGWEAVERFIIDKGSHLVMQSCVSPLWDTSISCNALLDAGLPQDHPALVKAAEWMLKKQVVKRGDWKIKNPHAAPGGWAFEFYNELYPDNDDTAEILMALHFIRVPDTHMKLKEFQRALSWLLSMQSRVGGWGAFDMDNDMEILNEIPFADHKALLDPPTSDVTSRILWLLGTLGYKREHPQAKRALAFVKGLQEPEGCWFGRWCVNYIYGTFLALTGLRAMGEDMGQEAAQKAVAWLRSRQNDDGGWGESCASYVDKTQAGVGVSTASQTAWAVMGLIAGGAAKSETARRGVLYLLDRQDAMGAWWENEFTGTGFPGHFYIKYHMYQHFFPLMALGRYRAAVEEGILEQRLVRQP